MINLKKYTALILVFSLITIFSIQPYVLAADNVIPIKKINEVEEIIYGETTSISIINKIAKLEQSLFGDKKEGSLVVRAENIADYVLAQGSSPSLTFILNSLEWTLAENITTGNIVERLNNLEANVFGKPRTGALVSRIERLANMSYPDGKIPGESVILTDNTELSLKLNEKLDSSVAQKGEIIEFEVAKNLEIDNKLVIPAGTPGKMRVTKVEEAGQFGKPGKIEVEFLQVRAIDGTVINLKRPEKEFFEERSRQYAIGAGILGAIVFSSPLGVAVSYFVPGNPESFETGSELIAVTVERNEIFALDTN